MAPSSISIPCVFLFLALIQSATLFKIFTVHDNQPNSQKNSPFDDETNQAFSLKTREYDDDGFAYDTNDDQVNDNLVPGSSSFMSEVRRPKFFWKRSDPSFEVRSLKALPQRRNNRPHWNPIVAAYRRCGTLSTVPEREACFKDAIQILFVPIS